MALAFDRFVPAMNRTFSLRAFNKCETEINKHFWSFSVISDYSGYIARNAQKGDPATLTSTVFHASGPDAVRIPPTVSDWLIAREELENWLRLSALVSAASYLEMYFRQVIRCSLMSDPLCRFGTRRAVDGTFFLKHSKELSYEHEVVEITKGDWNSRFKAFEKIFGPCPSVLTTNVKSLERIRTIRNEVAHGFGRDLNVPPPSSSSVSPVRSLSLKTLINYLSVISKVAATVDKYLLHRFIGNFELIHFYHDWKAQPRDQRDKEYNTARALQRAFNRNLTGTVSIPFCSGLISYYEAI